MPQVSHGVGLNSRGKKTVGEGMAPQSATNARLAGLGKVDKVVLLGSWDSGGWDESCI